MLFPFLLFLSRNYINFTFEKPINDGLLPTRARTEKKKNKNASSYWEFHHLSLKRPTWKRMSNEKSRLNKNNTQTHTLKLETNLIKVIEKYIYWLEIKTVNIPYFHFPFHFFIKQNGSPNTHNTEFRLSIKLRNNIRRK